MTKFIDALSDKFSRWIGSTSSLIFHTLFFIFTFASHWLFGWPFDLILLVLTTIVSLEAIYLAIFIQRSVNQQAERLEDVEEAIDEVEESIDEVEESIDDVEKALDEVEESIDDVEEDIEDFEKAAQKNKTAQATTDAAILKAVHDLQKLTTELQQAVAEIKKKD